MEALYYEQAGQFRVKTVDIPEIGSKEVLLKVILCGMCGTDTHIHKGEFISDFPLVPGHEVVGHIVKIGDDVTGFSIGDRVVADPGVTCGNCFYCRRGNIMMCENFTGLGVSGPGAFAEYFKVASNKLYKIEKMTDEAAVIVEPTACAIRGLDRLNLGVGAEVLVIGCGPTGLMLSQLLKLNGAMKLTIAAPAGPKLDLARKLEAGDEYVELSRTGPEAQWQYLKEANPHGFDAVVEATGNEAIINESINHVRRGGKLLVYGVYDDSALVHWSPSKIFRDEIEIIGSFAQSYCFPRAVAYLESGKLKTDGVISHTLTTHEYQQALDLMESRKCIKIAIRPTSNTTSSQSPF